jgi:hypothetical protein
MIYIDVETQGKSLDEIGALLEDTNVLRSFGCLETSVHFKAQADKVGIDIPVLRHISAARSCAPAVPGFPSRAQTH